MDKRTKIIDALEELFIEGKGGTASVSEIANKAGIAKGGLYYYFKSKEEVLEALVSRQYSGLIENVAATSKAVRGNAIERLESLFRMYYSATSDSKLDEYLHLQQNASIHQKSLTAIVIALSDIVTEIIEQGITEGVFVCENPREFSEIILSAMSFLLDRGLFSWSEEQRYTKIVTLSSLMDQYLSCPKGTFSFLYE